MYAVHKIQAIIVQVPRLKRVHTVCYFSASMQSMDRDEWSKVARVRIVVS